MELVAVPVSFPVLVFKTKLVGVKLVPTSLQVLVPVPPVEVKVTKGLSAE